MNTKWLNLVIAFSLCIGIPIILSGIISGGAVNDATSDVTNLFVSDQMSVQQTTSNVAISENSIKISVLTKDGDVEQMELNEYTTCVVLAEMPASFEIEALRAQAVVARTYALRRQRKNGKHDTAEVCMDPSCCQGYCTKEEYISSGGSETDYLKIKNAVEDTAYNVLIYNSELIEATYFSCSGGYTEDASEVWGEDVPYLQAIKSPGEEHAAHFTDTITFKTADFMKRLGVGSKDSSVPLLGNITYTDGNGVDEIVVCGKTLKGTEMRKLLGLRSTAFALTEVGDSVIITTRGYGHRVGMSQYGADAMAVLGNTYDQILAHYYAGTELISYTSYSD